MKRTLLWWLVNGLTAAMLYVGFFQGVKGAQNVFLFIVWLNFVISLCFISPEIQKSVQAKGRSVPAWFSVPYDIAMVVVMVWIGLWLTAIAWTVSSMLHNGVYLNAPEARSAT